MFLRTLFATALVAICAGQGSADEAPSPPEPTHAEKLDKLYARLAKTDDPRAADAIVRLIGEEEVQSGSDSANLLLARALVAKSGHHEDVALDILDDLVALRPEWSQAWSKRAAFRLETGDESGAMQDFAETLKRDPRDLDALAGLGAVLAQAQKFDQAEKVFQQALALAPAFQPLVDAETHVKAAIAAHSL
jgi:Flp pilus assembly protein TadD